jgi:hypothetical protein
MSKRRLRAEVVRLKIELASYGPIIAAAEELREVVPCGSLAQILIAANHVCAAVGAREAPAPEPVEGPAGFVPDAPAQSPEDVAAFLASYDWPGDAP